MKKLSNSFLIFLIYIAYIGIVIESLLPVYFMLKYAISDRDSLVMKGKVIPLWPYNPNLNSFKYIFSNSHFLEVCLNSIILAFLTLIISITIGVICAYGLSKISGKIKYYSLLFLTAIRFFPDIVSVIPFTNLMIKLRLDGTLLGAAIGHSILALPYVIFILLIGFSALPKELEEQAYNLGASRIYTFRKILLPLVLPSIAVSAIYVFILSWDEFIYSYYILGFSSIETLPLYLKNILSFQPPLNILMAVSMVLTIPALIFSFMIQKFIINDLSRGALK